MRLTRLAVSSSHADYDYGRRAAVITEVARKFGRRGGKAAARNTEEYSVKAKKGAKAAAEKPTVEGPTRERACTEAPICNSFSNPWA
jgi:hypothetical protein